MTPNMRDTLASLRADGFIVGCALHLYSHENGYSLIMYCGAVSRMPEQSAPYLSTTRSAFLQRTDTCPACRACATRSLTHNAATDHE